MGKTKDILDVDPHHLFYDWRILEVDGHNYFEIEVALSDAFFSEERPTLIIANTVKGSGGQTACNVFENKLEWHYRYVDEETYKIAIELLSQEKM